MRRIIVALCVALAAGGYLSGSAGAQSPKPDPRTAGSDVVGKIRPVHHPTSMVGVPAAHRQTMETHLQRLVAILLRDPALQPPVGFEFRTGTHAYSPPLPVSAHAPLACTVTGLIYWYTYKPGSQPPIQPEPISMEGFFLRGNDISTVFDRLERWQTDEEGKTYWEPREIRKVAGFPQYSTGAVVVKRNPRPIWAPVSREWALRRELAQFRKSLEGVAKSEAEARAFDPMAPLEKWLRERPQRQRDMEKSYAEMKPFNPQHAEKIRANHFEMEKKTEKIMREVAERQKTRPPHNKARIEKERQGVETCIGYLEGELARLSPAERAAPAYVSLGTPDRKRPSPPGCSSVVDTSFPEARRIVKENPDYYDPALPPSAIQLILVDFSYFEGSVRVAPPWRHAAYERIRDGLDYSALEAMLQE